MEKGYRRPRGPKCWTSVSWQTLQEGTRGMADFVCDPMVNGVVYENSERSLTVITLDDQTQERIKCVQQGNRRQALLQLVQIPLLREDQKAGRVRAARPGAWRSNVRVIIDEAAKEIVGPREAANVDTRSWRRQFVNGRNLAQFDWLSGH